MGNILITGSSGVIGIHLAQRLRHLGYSICPFDIQPNVSFKELYLQKEHHSFGIGTSRDLLNPEMIADVINGCTGIIHLAAVSRVGKGEQDPTHCRRVNIQGTRNLLQAITKRKHPPWFLFTSSREVYGQSQSLPVRETCPILPINVYGQSKAEAEQEIWRAREATGNLRVAVLRLTNVYGSLYDHSDRVIPALTRGALCGESLRLSGMSRIFDFIHIHDVVDGILKTVEQLDAGERSLPPINLVSGIPTTLERVTQIIQEHVHRPLCIDERPHQKFDVIHFYGDGALAKKLLGWSAKTAPDQGISDFLTRMRDHIPTHTRS